MGVKAAQECLKVVKKRGAGNERACIHGQVKERTCNMYQSARMRGATQAQTCTINKMNCLNTVVDHLVLSLPLTALFRTEQKQEKKQQQHTTEMKKNFYHINEEAACTALHFSGTSHPSASCCSESQAED